MGFLKNIANVVRKSLSPNLQAFLRGEDLPTGGAQLRNGYEQSTWVYAAVNALAKNVSQIPFRISQGEANNENIIARGPVVDLFKKPHDFLDRFLFWELLVTWLALRGEAFMVALDNQGRVIAVRNAGGRNNQIAKLLILSPDRFWHIIEAGTLQGWRYTGMNYNDPPMESQIFLPEEVMQLRLPNPFLFWRGLSPLSVARLAAETDYASAQFMKGLMLNNADTGVIVTTDQQASPEQQEQIMSALKARKRMAGTADRPLFLWGGAKIEKPTVSSADMQFLENRKLNRLEIGAVYGVPATVMGFSEDANRAIASTERLNFIEQTILPLCARLEAFIEPIVQTFGRDYMGFFHGEALPIMQEARRQRGQAAQQFFTMGVPLNDINRVFDLGLPKYDWGNTGYLPLNLHPIGSITPDEEQNQDDGPETEAGRAAKSLDKMLAVLREIPRHQPCSRGALDGDCLVSSLQAVPDREHAKAWTPNNVRHPSTILHFPTLTSGAVKALKGKLSKLFFEQRSRVLAKMAQLQKSVAENGSSAIAKSEGRMSFQPGTSQTENSRSQLQRGIEHLFDVNAENQELLTKLKPTLITTFESSATQLSQERGLPDFHLPPEATTTFLQSRESHLTAINETTHAALKQSLSLGLQNAETHAQLIDRVKQIFQHATDHRADQIATIETNAALTAARSRSADIPVRTNA